MVAPVVVPDTSRLNGLAVEEPDHIAEHILSSFHTESVTRADTFSAIFSAKSFASELRIPSSSFSASTRSKNSKSSFSRSATPTQRPGLMFQPRDSICLRVAILQSPATSAYLPLGKLRFINSELQASV